VSEHIRHQCVDRGVQIIAGQTDLDPARWQLHASRDGDRAVQTELIKRQGSWRTPEQIEIATLHYIDWFNRQRLFEACGDIPPAELEAAHYGQNAALAEAD